MDRNTRNNEWHIEWDDYPFAIRHSDGARMEIRDIECRLNETDNIIQLKAENERLREAIEETLEHRGPDWASILRHALGGES